MTDFSDETLLKITMGALGPEKADEYGSLLRLGLISADDARGFLMDALVEMPELLVTDTKPGRR